VNAAMTKTNDREQTPTVLIIVEKKALGTAKGGD
jgi:hypothetical protein